MHSVGAVPQVLGGSAAGIFSSVPPEYATGTGRGKGPKGTVIFQGNAWIHCQFSRRHAEVQKDNSNQEKEAEEAPVAAIPTGCSFRKCRPSEQPKDTNRSHPILLKCQRCNP